MLYISYNGIFNGTNFPEIATPNQIGSSLNHGFSCMINIWRVNGQSFMGYDQPLIPVADTFYQGNRFWLSIQNNEMYSWVQSQPAKRYPNYFYFPNPAVPTPVATSGGQMIVPGNMPTSTSDIMYLPEIPDRGLLSAVKFRCYGVISNYLTFIKRARFEGIWQPYPTWLTN